MAAAVSARSMTQASVLALCGALLAIIPLAWAYRRMGFFEAAWTRAAFGITALTGCCVAFTGAMSGVALVLALQGVDKWAWMARGALACCAAGLLLLLGAHIVMLAAMAIRDEATWTQVIGLISVLYLFFASANAMVLTIRSFRGQGDDDAVLELNDSKVRRIKHENASASGF